METLSLAELDRRACMRPWETSIGPVRMSPHSWYVGDAYVGAVIVETKDGIVLLDTGLFGQMYMIFEAIRNLGYNPKNDIKLCLLTHAHLDHCSGMGLLQHYSHPKMYMSPFEACWPAHPEIYYGHRLNDYIPYEVDQLYNYDLPIEHGGFTFHVMHTPGHTEGTSSIFFEDTDEESGITYKVGMHGGLGLNTLVDAKFTCAEDARAARTVFRENLLLWRELPVDITIFNHPGNIDLVLSSVEDTNDFHQFVNRNFWVYQIDKKIRELDELERDSVFR